MTRFSDNRLSSVTNIRRALLNFLQSLFSEDKTYTWTTDPNGRKIDIVNEFSTGIKEIEKYPKVVLRRGDMHLEGISINRTGANQIWFKPDTKHYQDLARGTIILNVLAKQAIEAEQIAEKIYLSLVSWRDELRWSKYLKKLERISLGTIQPISQDADFRVFQVPVYIAFSKEINFYKTFDYYDAEVTVNGEVKYSYNDYTIFQNFITFNEAPASGADIYMKYLHRDTLSGVNEYSLTGANGILKTFLFTYPIYGPHYIVSGLDFILVNKDLDTFFDYYTLYEDVEVTQESGPRVHRQGHSYILPGNIEVAVGDTSFIPPFYVSMAAGQLIRIVKATYKLNTGGTATCHILHEGQILPTYSGIVVTTTETSSDAADILLTDGESLGILVAETSGSPQNMTFTIFLDYIQ